MRSEAPPEDAASEGAGHLQAADLSRSASKLAAALDAVTEGITVQSPSGGVILANEAAARMIGFPSVPGLLSASPAELLAHFDLLDEEGQPLEVDQLPGRAALRGEEPPEILVRWRARGAAAERFSLVGARPVRDEHGEVQFAVSVFRDVTTRQVALQALRASEARLAFLATASRRLMTTALEPRRVLEEATALVVPKLADWCTVRELDEGGGFRSGPPVQRGRPEDRELLTRLKAYGDVLRDHPAVDDVLAGRSLLVSEITPAMLEEVARDEEHLALLGRLGLRSLMLVPLRTGGRIVGVLTLAVGSDRPAYGEDDLALAEDLAIPVAAAMGNARSFAVERATAETLTRALLPGHLPDIPGLQLAARYRASGDVGGDFYDCFPTHGGTWMLVVGDVCGRGIHAASMTGLTRHTIRAAALHARPPAAVLGDLNQLLLDAAGEGMSAWSSRDDGGAPSFCTVCLAEVTPSATRARVVVSSAGHPLPLVVRSDGQVTEVGRPGSLLGVLTDLKVSEQTFDLGPGDALVLFTDGITERRRDGHLFEEELPGTLQALAGASASEVARQVEDAALAFGAGAVGDDMAVLTISVPRAAAGEAEDRGPALARVVGR